MRIGLGLGIGVGSGSASAWSPMSLGSELAMWLRADTVTTSVGAVSTWNDKSGNGRAPAATSPPTWRDAGHARCINGMPVVDWDGTDNRMDFAIDAFAALTAAEIFLVGRIDVDPPAAAGQTGLWRFGTAVNGDHFPYTDGNVYAEFGTTVRKNTGNPTANLTSAFCLNVISVSGEWTMNINGAQHFTTATNTVGLPSAAILGAYTAGSAKFDGVMAEVIMCSAKLSAANRALVKTYIASRYALTLA